MKAKIVSKKNTFVGEIVSWDLNYKGHVIDLGQIQSARLGTHFGTSYILFNDNTHFAVSERGLFRNKMALRGTITLRVSSLSEDICFDIREVEDSFIPAEDGHFIHRLELPQKPPVDDRRQNAVWRPFPPTPPASPHPAP